MTWVEQAFRGFIGGYSYLNDPQVICSANGDGSGPLV